MAAITTLLVVVAVSMLVTRVATVILTATGMSREAARFQARSAFSTAGFTTRESEAVVDHPIRRKVIGGLMLFGSAGLVAVVSTAILGLGRTGAGTPLWRIAELVLGLVALLVVSRNRWVDRRLTAAISWVLRRFTKLPTRDIASLLDLDSGFSVHELAVRENDWVADHSLRELGLRDEGLVVLAVTRADGRRLAAPTGKTLVRPGDVLVIYGPDDLLSQLDDRAQGAAGDEAHRYAVAQQERRERDEELADRPETELSATQR
ncbi:MAG: TrkA C-terminal domain-containing protein [Mycobacteriales bacterium]